MLKRDYFIRALAHEAPLHRSWVLEAFSYVADLTVDKANEEVHPCPLKRDDQGRYYAQSSTDADQWELLEDAPPKQAPFTFKEVLELKPGELANVHEKVKTCYGDVLFNAMVLVYSFGNKVPYMNGRIKASAIQDIILKKMADPPKNGGPLPEGAITVEEYLRFGQAMYALAGFTQLCVPSATPKTMTTHPKMAELRAELLKKYKGRLNDPVVIAEIEAQLVALDREWLKGDEGEGFYIKDKSYNVVRKRLFGMFGGEDPFGDGTSVTLIEKSLNDGWDITKLPAMASSSREGSFSRGAETELGGAITKEINRYSTNSSITEEDCGTKLGLPTRITAQNKKRYLDNYIFVGGKEVLTTEENIDQYVDQVVEVRSPVYCRTAGSDFCVHCCGVKLAQTPNAIGSYCADIGSTFMLVSMKKMHGTALATAPWDLNTSIL